LYLLIGEALEFGEKLTQKIMIVNKKMYKIYKNLTCFANIVLYTHLILLPYSLQCAHLINDRLYLAGKLLPFFFGKNLSAR